MACKRCTSDSQRAFSGEVAIHFPGLKGLDEPIVWSFPKLLVCLECGFTEFTVPERELSVLALGKSGGERGGLRQESSPVVGSVATDGWGLASVQVLNRQSEADKLSALKNRIHSS